jgi:predicted RNA-binding protein YlqC (UPF0109 family)
MYAEELLQIIVEEVVDQGTPVIIERTIDERGTLMKVILPESGMPQVIGKSGQMALALRTIMRSVGRKEDARISVKIEVGQ